MGRREITVEEITQALTKRTGDEEVGVDKGCQGLIIRKI
jgi:hypothetical protein